MRSRNKLTVPHAKKTAISAFKLSNRSKNATQCLLKKGNNIMRHKSLIKLATRKRLRTILIAISLLGLISTPAISEDLGCLEDFEDLLQIGTKTATIHLCDSEPNDGSLVPTIMYIYPKKPKTRKGFKVVKVVAVETETENNDLYVAANGDDDPFRYTISARSRRFTITNGRKTVSRQRIIYWCDLPGVANKCRF